MAFVRLIFKARKIEKIRFDLEDEKLKSFQISQGQEVQYSLKQRYRHFWIDLRIRFRKWLKRTCWFPKQSCMYRTAYKLKHEGTCENFTLKSVVGFISGFFLTYIFFMFFVFQLNFKLSTATIMCSFFGSILTIGLAFSYKVRCVVLLLLPQFFSKRGRQALMAYAFILAITGPAKNTLHNMGILSESLACGQIQSHPKQSMKQLVPRAQGDNSNTLSLRTMGPLATASPTPRGISGTPVSTNMPSNNDELRYLVIQREYQKFIKKFNATSNSVTFKFAPVDAQQNPLLWLQEQLKAAVRQIVEVIKKPFYAIRDAVRTVVKTVKVIVKAIKEVLLTIKRTIMAILKVIKAAFQFLGKILNICNKELGTPFERCMRVFEDAIVDCNAKLGPLFNWLCSITYLVQSVCYIVKVFDFICIIVDFISDSIIGVVVRKIKIFVRHVKTMFYVRIRFSHSFSFETNQSKSITEITTGIVTEIRQRTEKLLTVFDFMSCATSLFFLFIILRVLNYRYKFLTSERYDNRFITKNFREIDMKRAQLEKETVLPLNHRELSLYISVGSIRLVKSERRKLSKAAVALGMITLKLSTHMMADYALYWVLTVIRYHARFQSNVQAPNLVGLHVEGKGFIASLLRSIVTAFQPLGVHLEIDTIPCLPDPIPPDYDRYIQIASLLILCWILTIFEPYGLRLRHSVMCYYHPIRARQRAIWLYNHIIRSRLSFLKFARRQLRRKFIGTKGITKITFQEYLRANLNCKLIQLCLGESKQDACLVCGEIFRESDTIKPIRCMKPGCPGTYCEQCFADLQNLCTVCMEPVQYGDLSDVSEEKDSSVEEEEDSEKKKKKQKQKRSTFFIKKRGDDEDDDDDDDDKGEKKLLRPPPSTSSEQSKSDSDYFTSSGSTTDNSYTYQTIKKVEDNTNTTTSPRFKDTEKQRIPDYASWNSFRNESSDEGSSPESDEPQSRTKSRKNSSRRTTSATTSFLDSPLNTSPSSGKNATILSDDDIESIQMTRRRSKRPKRKKSKRRKREISLSDITTVTSLSLHRSDLDSSSQEISSDTETTFIETPSELCKDDEETTSSLDSELKRCQKCGKYKAIPLLDLQFEDAGTLRQHSPTGNKKVPNFIDGFNKNIRYEVVYETPASAKRTHTASPRSPLDANYSIVVPRYDTFRDPSNSAPEDRISCLPQKNKSFSERVRQFKQVQRKNRSDEIARKSNANKTQNVSDNDKHEGASDEVKMDYYNSKTKVSSQSDTENIQRQKIKDYYKKINNVQPVNHPVGAKKNRNKFLNFIKKIFRQADVKNEPYKLHSSKLFLEKCETDISVPSPKSVEELFPIQDSTSSTARSSNSRFLTDSSTTTSTNSTRMGSTESHIRGGADTKLQDSDESFTTTTPTTTTATTTTNTGSATSARGKPRPKSTNLVSSDSELSDLDLILGAPRRLSPRLGDKFPMTTNANKSLAEIIPRYSREPAERDQDPSSSTFSSTTSNGADQNNETKIFDKTMCEECTSSDISPRTIANIKGRYCYGYKPDDFVRGVSQDRYRNCSQPPTTPCCSKRRSNSAVRFLEEPTNCPNDVSERRYRDFHPKMFSNIGDRLSDPEECCDYYSDKPILCRNCNAQIRPPPERRTHSLDRPRRISNDSENYNRFHFQPNAPPVIHDREDCRNPEDQYCTCNSHQISSPRRLMEDEVSYISGHSGRRKCPELVYQNTDEFLELVNELGDTLSLRNKERVEKTIREFEHLSSQNRNLEKPIFEDDVDVIDDPRDVQNRYQSRHLCNHCKDSSHQKYEPCKTKFTRFETRTDGPVQQTAFQQYHRSPNNSDRLPSFSNYQNNSRWEMHPRTKQWYKIACDNEYDEDDYLPSSAPPRQASACERRRNSRNSSDRNGRSCTPPPAYICNNCGFPRDQRY